MSIEKQINIKVTNSGTEKAIAQTDKLKAKLKQLDSATGEVSKGMKESSLSVLENGGAMGLLNDATGGVAMTIKDAVEATGLFTKGTAIATVAQKAYTFVVGTTTGALKALRLALAATGIGAIVVALGFLIEKLMSSTDATEEQVKAQEQLNIVLDETNKLYKESISAIDEVTKVRLLRAKIAGKSEAELSAIEKEGSKERARQYKEEQARLYALLDGKNVGLEESKKINQQLADNQKAYLKSLEDENIKSLESELSVADKRREQQKADAKKRAEDLAKQRDEQLKAQREFQAQLAKDIIEFESITNVARRQSELDAFLVSKEDKLANNQDLTNAIAQLDAEDQARKDKLAQDEKNREEVINTTRVNLRTNAENLIGAIAKKGSALAKGLAVANIVREQVQSASASISNLAIANAKAAAASPLTAGQPFVTINTASTIAGIAGSAIGAGKAIKDILSESKSASGSSAPSGGGGGSSVPSAPSFNLVAGTGTNQIAQGLASGQSQPIQAFVVSGAVTTAQSADRNIINDASI